MLDAVINVLIEKLVDGLLNEGCHLLEFHKQFKAVKQELELMQSYIKHVERVRRKDHNEILKTVVRQLRELLYDAEDIISDCELFLKSERRKRASKLKKYCSPSFLKFRYRLGKKLHEINQEIQNHRERMTSYLPTTPILLNQFNQLGIHNGAQRFPVLMNDTEIVGRDKDARKIQQWVLNAHDEFLNVIGIVGMGGIGKTTLVQKLYNDGKLKIFFDYVFKLTVSQTFKLEDLIKNMLKKLDATKDLFASIDVQCLLEELRDRLEGKRCLVILDDVWRQDEGWSWWESLKSSFPPRNCCVIVTSRDEEVARSMGVIEAHVHHPEILSIGDSWSLFSKIAFAGEGGRCPNLELERTGKEIVAGCGGLPLAIKVVAGMMMKKRSSTDEWARMSKNLKEELAKKGEPIFSVLELSYEELPWQLKPCMLCLAAYPEDFLISSREIIAWWIGEGFVRAGEFGRTAYDNGKEYLDELISRCLLLLDYEDTFGRKVSLFRVHDMVREMMRRISKEENFISINDGGLSSCMQSRRVCMVTNTGTNLFREETNFKSLRTVTVINLKESEAFVLNLGSMLCQLKWLRVLDIRFLHSSSQPPTTVDWLSGIQLSRHLVCLIIRNSGLERLPDSTGNLQSLQILSLANCPNLKILPKNIAFLEKLIMLDIYDCESIECLPIEIGNLRQLCIFSFNTKLIGKHGFHISGLKKLAQLRLLCLKISASSSEDEIGEGKLRVLSELTQLEVMTIKFQRNNNDVEEPLQLARTVDYQLSPLHQLADLYLFFYPGERTPIWLNPTSLPNLRYLHIHCGNITHMRPEFFGRREEENNNGGGVWKLEVLLLSGLFELEEEWPRIQRAMPYLLFLKVVECPKLKSLPCEVDEFGIGVWKRREESTSN